MVLLAGGSDCQQSRKAGAIHTGGRQLCTDFDVFADRTVVIEVAHEPRAAVMIVVEVSWVDQRGTLQAVRARMENKSAGGACIRIRTPIEVGSKLKIQWRWEQFSGVAKYCLSDGMEYLVGIQRDTKKGAVLNHPVPTASPVRNDVRNSNPPVSSYKIQSPPKLDESKPSEIPVAQEKVEVVSIIPIVSGTTAIPARDAGNEIDGSSRPRISQTPNLDALRATEPQTKQPPQEKQAGKEGTHMRRKWLESALWSNKQDDLSGSGNGKSDGAGEKRNIVPPVVPVPEKLSPTLAGAGVANCSVELLPMEDIYRAAGIMNPRRGYGINKVVEMLHSEHVRGLSREMKRAAVLMALDAAGIPIDEVLMDGRARQNALDSYEAGQKKQVEVEWSRKAEESVQIQAELERVKEQYAARISRQLNGVAQEKAAFSSWQATKQQEFQSMSEAAELCLKSPVPEPPSPPLAETSTATSAKPV
jgi:hypothetical protein